MVPEEPIRRGPEDPMRREPVTPVPLERRAESVAMPRISFAALFTGAIVAISLQAIFTMLGVAIGLSVTDPAGLTGEGFAIGTGIWWLVSGLVSLFIGGWAAARAAGIPTGGYGLLHGFVTWGLMVTLSLFLLTWSGSVIIGGSMSAFNQNWWTISEAGQQEQLTPEAGATEPGRETMLDVERQPAGTDQAAVQEETLTQASWWAFGAMVLGAAAATFGGWVGTPRRPTALPVT